MQFDARVDAFVPRDSGIESMRYDFFLDRERERRGREKKQTIPESRIAFQWPGVVDDEYKGL